MSVEADDLIQSQLSVVSDGTEDSPTTIIITDTSINRLRGPKRIGSTMSENSTTSSDGGMNANGGSATGSLSSSVSRGSFHGADVNCTPDQLREILAQGMLFPAAAEKNSEGTHYMDAIGIRPMTTVPEDFACSPAEGGPFGICLRLPPYQPPSCPSNIFFRVRVGHKGTKRFIKTVRHPIVALYLYEMVHIFVNKFQSIDVYLNHKSNFYYMKKIGLVEDFSDHFSKLVTFCEHSTLVDKHLRDSVWPILIQLTPRTYMLRGTAVKIEAKQLQEKEKEAACQAARAAQKAYALNEAARKATYKAQIAAQEAVRAKLDFVEMALLESAAGPGHVGLTQERDFLGKIKDCLQVSNPNPNTEALGYFKDNLHSPSGHKSRRGWDNDGNSRYRLNSDSVSVRSGGSRRGSHGGGGSESGSRRGGSESGSRRGGSDSGSRRGGSESGSTQCSSLRGSASSAHARGSQVSSLGADLNVFTRPDDACNHASMCELLHVDPLPTTLARPPIFVGWDREGMVLSVRKLTGEHFSRS